MCTVLAVVAQGQNVGPEIVELLHELAERPFHVFVVAEVGGDLPQGVAGGVQQGFVAVPRLPAFLQLIRLLQMLENEAPSDGVGDDHPAQADVGEDELQDLLAAVFSAGFVVVLGGGVDHLGLGFLIVGASWWRWAAERRRHGLRGIRLVGEVRGRRRRMVLGSWGLSPRHRRPVLLPLWGVVGLTRYRWAHVDGCGLRLGRAWRGRKRRLRQVRGVPFTGYFDVFHF